MYTYYISVLLFLMIFSFWCDAKATRTVFTALVIVALEPTLAESFENFLQSYPAMLLYESLVIMCLWLTNKWHDNFKLYLPSLFSALLNYVYWFADITPDTNLISTIYPYYHSANIFLYEMLVMVCIQTLYIPPSLKTLWQGFKIRLDMFLIKHLLCIYYTIKEKKTC